MFCLRKLQYLMSLAMCFYCSFALAQTNIQLSLLQTEPFRVPIDSESYRALNSGQLRAFLGKYDVTSLLSYDDSAIYLHHSGAVEAGRYIFVVELVTPEKTVELNRSTLTFYQPKWSGASQLTSSGSYELNSDQNDSFSQNIQRLSESALRMQAQRLGKHFDTKLAVDVQQRSDANTLSGERLEIPNFLISVEQQSKIGNLGFAIGNQLFEQNSLVFNGFNRRGLSAKLESDQDRYKLNTFIINTDPEVSSKDNVLIAGAKSERSAGATFDFSPFKQEPERLKLASGYIDGRSELQGIGLSYGLDSVENASVSYGGATWFIAATSQWLEQSLTVEFEQARSSVDSDGFGIGEAEQSDTANRYRLLVNSQGPLGEIFTPLNMQQWQVSLLKQKVGPDFYSFANLGLPGDLDTEQGGVQLSWNEVQLSIDAQKINTNVDDDAARPTQTSRHSQLALYYTPNIPSSEGFLKLFGSPSINIQYGQTLREQDIQDAALVGYDVDDKTTDIQLSAQFQKDALNWSVQWGKTDYTNSALTQTPEGLLLFASNPSTVNTFTSLGLNINPLPNVSISPTLQQSKYEDLDQGTRQNALNVGLQTNLSLFKQRLNVFFNHNYSQQENEFGGAALDQKYTSQQSSLAINWLAIEAKKRNAGLKVSFRSTWNEQKISFQQDQDGYQILLGLEMYWAAGAQ
jgi:hypothetical protein